ncbi:MAG: haloacid dehalogenase [Phycisphaeraceae bacterium]|nr:MAG: haloacid dehalogenase [Phycisphaeraceae bacterium]
MFAGGADAWRGEAVRSGMVQPTVRRAAIFDFDGVLVDSEPTHMDSILRTIRGEGWDADPGEMFREFVGTSDRFCFVTLAERHGVTLDEDAVNRLIERKLGHFLDAVEGGAVVAHAGAFELIRAAAEVVPVVVCSGSRRNTVLPVLERFGVAGVVRGVVGADDVTNTKPDPEAYRAACALAGEDPGACVTIEDTDHGIASGVDAGLRVIGVRHTWDNDRLARADEVFDRIGQITVEDLLGR